MPVSRKLVKVATKLKKLWPRKKKNKKLQLHPPPPVMWIKEAPPLPPPQVEYYYLPPPQFTCSSSSSSFQPSAPPLPPWLDLEPVQGKADESVLLLSNTATTSSSYHVSSYQQYTVPSPDYGGAVALGRRGPRDGFYGWVVGFVVNVFGCFCPCLRITEAR